MVRNDNPISPKIWTWRTYVNKMSTKSPEGEQKWGENKFAQTFQQEWWSEFGRWEQIFSWTSEFCKQCAFPKKHFQYFWLKKNGTGHSTYLPQLISCDFFTNKVPKFLPYLSNSCSKKIWSLVNARCNQQPSVWAALDGQLLTTCIAFPH